VTLRRDQRRTATRVPAGLALSFSVRLRLRGAQASAGRLLYDTAGGDAAALLEGSRLCCTRQLRNLLPCLGGVAVLLPLLEQLGARAGASPLCLSGAGGRMCCGVPRLII